MTFTFHWQVQNGANWDDIGGATNASFTPGAGEVGRAIRVVVSFTDAEGTGESRTSAASQPVVAAAHSGRRARPEPRARAEPDAGGADSGPELGRDARAASGCSAAPRAASTAAPAWLSGLTISAAAGSPITVAANVPSGARVSPDQRAPPVRRH